MSSTDKKLELDDPSPDARMNPDRTDADLVLRKIDRDLRAQFKAYCAERGRSMTEVIVEFMYNTVTGEQERIQRKRELRALKEEAEIERLRKKK